eukprot:5612950-Pyramimonas_sp.AAC.1
MSRGAPRTTPEGGGGGYDNSTCTTLHLHHTCRGAPRGCHDAVKGHMCPFSAVVSGWHAPRCRRAGPDRCPLCTPPLPGTCAARKVVSAGGCRLGADT